MNVWFEFHRLIFLLIALSTEQKYHPVFKINLLLNQSNVFGVRQISERFRRSTNQRSFSAFNKSVNVFGVRLIAYGLNFVRANAFMTEILLFRS